MWPRFAQTLGVTAPVRESGDVAGSGACKLVGPCGEVEIAEGVIAAKRHIHLTPADAEEFGVSDKEIVSVKIESDGRTTIFGDAEKAQLEIIKVQNEQKINTAQAEAEVRKLQSESVTEKSLEQLRLEIQRELIQKWNGQFPTTMLGDNPNMLFNLND